MALESGLCKVVQRSFNQGNNMFGETTCIQCACMALFAISYLTLTLKRMGRGGEEGSILPPPPCGFLKNVSSKERVKPWSFFTFNIIIRHIYPENFIEISQVV